MQRTSEDIDLEATARGIHPLFSSAHWGMHVIDADSKQVLYTHNASRLFVPASVAKLFTTAAALEVLGPSHRFHTRVRAAAVPDHAGVVKGDFYLVGGGDPSLTSEGLRELAKRAYEAGVRTVCGDVIVDDTLFDGCSLPTHGQWEDLPLDWAAEESALSVNGNSVEVVVAPNSAGVGLAQVRIKQDVPYCQLVNRVMTDRNITEPALAITRGLTDNVIEVQGVIPAESIPINTKIAVHHPQEYAKAIFLKALQDSGIVVTKASHPDIMGDLHEVAAVSSAPLLSIIHEINTHSLNLSANLLLKYTNKQVSASAAGGHGASSAITSLLHGASIPPGGCLLCDGSGLSRHNLVTPEQTVKLLEYMGDGPYQSAFADSLARPGADGTLATRFAPGLFPGMAVKAKTGELSGVSSLAGFVHLDDGRRLIFAVFINCSLRPEEETADALDRLLRHVAFSLKRLRTTGQPGWGQDGGRIGRG